MPTFSTQHTVAAGFLFKIVLVFAMALPMLVLYTTSTLGPMLSTDLDFDITLLGYIVMSSFGLAAVISLCAGHIVNTIGTRYALLILFFAVAVAFILISTTENFYGLILAAAICGVAQALANPATNTLIAQQVAREKKAKIVGLKQSGVQLAAIFAGLILPGIAFQYGWRVAFGVIAPVALFFCIAVIYVTSQQHTKINHGFTFSRPNTLLFWLMGIQFCIGVSLSAYVTYLPTFAIRQEMSLSFADGLIAVFGVMGMLSRIFLTPLGAKLKDESLLLFMLSAIAACAITVTLFATPENHWRLWVGAVGMGLTAVATNAIAMSMLIRDSAFGSVATASSFVSVAFFGGFAIGPPVFAVLANFSGDFLLGWSMMICILIIACIQTFALASARRRTATLIVTKTIHTT